MNEKMLNALQAAGVDTPRAVQRFAGNAELYEKFLVKFLDDPNFSLIGPALDEKDFGAVLTAAHTLKGVSANLGMTRLYQSCSGMVAALRCETPEKAADHYGELEAAYQEICEIIDQTKQGV
ncbi:Hpt domain-containing protein [Candidatus Soleaferrea massiliensis]|uniref:Hpt domain-containing protein n=1 Tax=Candidatus Soleaferrea massiliensis TaxID=1470354 RepID=UPI00058DA313|nr:Hpt domain-containing protein [Candidatus Soleaferrea massiliensis]